MPPKTSLPCCPAAQAPRPAPPQDKKSTVLDELAKVRRDVQEESTWLAGLERHACLREICFVYPPPMMGRVSDGDRFPIGEYSNHLTGLFRAFESLDDVREGVEICKHIYHDASIMEEMWRTYHSSAAAQIAIEMADEKHEGKPVVWFGHGKTRAGQPTKPSSIMLVDAVQWHDRIVLSRSDSEPFAPRQRFSAIFACDVYTNRRGARKAAVRDLLQLEADATTYCLCAKGGSHQDGADAYAQRLKELEACDLVDVDERDITIMIGDNTRVVSFVSATTLRQLTASDIPNTLEPVPRVVQLRSCIAAGDQSALPRLVRAGPLLECHVHHYCKETKIKSPGLYLALIDIAMSIYGGRAFVPFARVFEEHAAGKGSAAVGEEVKALQQSTGRPAADLVEGYCMADTPQLHTIVQVLSGLATPDKDTLEFVQASLEEKMLRRLVVERRYDVVCLNKIAGAFGNKVSDFASQNGRAGKAGSEKRARDKPEVVERAARDGITLHAANCVQGSEDRGRDKPEVVERAARNGWTLHGAASRPPEREENLLNNSRGTFTEERRREAAELVASGATGSGGQTLSNVGAIMSLAPKRIQARNEKLEAAKAIFDGPDIEYEYEKELCKWRFKHNGAPLTLGSHRNQWQTTPTLRELNRPDLFKSKELPIAARAFAEHPRHGRLNTVSTTPPPPPPSPLPPPPTVARSTLSPLLLPPAVARPLLPSLLPPAVPRPALVLEQPPKEPAKRARVAKADQKQKKKPKAFGKESGGPGLKQAKLPGFSG